MKAPVTIPPGIFGDDTAFAMQARWRDGNNARPWNGSMEVIGGWTQLTSGLSGVCRAIASWTDNNGAVTIALGTHSHLYARRNGVDHDITPTADFTAGAADGAGGPGFGAGPFGGGEYGGGINTSWFALTWSLANWGENLLANPRGQSIFIWQNDVDVEAVRIPNAPDYVTAMLMTPQRQVMAFGCNEEVSGDLNMMCIRWSDIGDYDMWTTGGGDNQSAGEYILPGAGRIISARAIGPYIGVWTDNSVYLGQYVGETGQIWRFDRVEENCGLAGPNAVIVLNQTAYWSTPDLQFYVWPLGASPKLLPCPVQSDYKNNAVRQQREKICATSLAQRGEIWFFYPDKRDGQECSRYVALSTLTGAWFRGVMARSAVADAGPNRNPLFVAPDGRAYWHEDGQSANGDVLEWSLRSADQYVEEGGRGTLIRGIWPDFRDQVGAVSLKLYTRMYPQDEEVFEEGPFVLAAGMQKEDFLAQGRLIEMEFFGSSAPSFARFGKPVFDIELTGEE